MDALDQTRSLARYIEDTFDFGIDIFDPIVSDAAEILLNITRNDTIENKPPLEDEAFKVVAVAGCVAHVTANVRYQLLLALETQQSAMKKEDIPTFDLARTALEAPDLYPIMIGLVLSLYPVYLLRAAGLHILMTEATVLLQLKPLKNSEGYGTFTLLYPKQKRKTSLQ